MPIKREMLIKGEFMKRLFLSLFLMLVMAGNVQAAILVMSQNGSHTTKLTLEAARTAPEIANKTVVVTSALTQAQSNIDPAGWPSDRALRVEKGGSIANSTAFAINGPFEAGLYQVFTGAGAVTGLKESRPEWFNSVSLAVASLSSGGTLFFSANSTYAANSITIATNNITFKGAGLSSVINGSATPSQTMFTVTGDNFTCESIKFVSLSTATDLFGTAGIAFKMHGSNALFQNNWFEGYAAAINQYISTGKSGITIRDNDFYKNTYFPINLLDSAAITANANSQAVTLLPSNAIIDHNNFHGDELRATIGATSYYGAYVCNMDYVKNVTISNNYVSTMTQNCINNQDRVFDSGYIVENIKVLNNTVDKCDTIGAAFFEFQHINGLLVQGNTVKEGVRAIFQVDYSSSAHAAKTTYNKNVSIVDNEVTLTATYDATTSRFAFQFNNITGLNVSDNFIRYNRSLQTAAGRLDSGISVKTCNNVSIRNNTIDGTNLAILGDVLKWMKYGIYIDSANTNVITVGNTVDNCEYYHYLSGLLEFGVDNIFRNTNKGNVENNYSWGYSRTNLPYYRDGATIIASSAVIPAYAVTAFGMGMTWNKGDRVTSTVTAAGGTEGWVCTTTGTFGPAITQTVTGDGSTTVILSAVSTLKVGQYITIAAGAANKIVSISGTTMVMTAVVAAGAGQALAYSPPVMKTFGVIQA